VPAFDEALRSGEVSPAQARAMAPAANDENAKRLVDSAKRESFKDLKRTCANEKARTRSAEKERERQERIHKERFFRDWTDDEGAYRFEGSATAAVGARIRAALEAEADNVFKAAYAEGRREPSGAYRMDALENLITGGGAKVDTQVVIRVDEERLRGGGGVCETPTGPVDVEEAIGAILADAFVTVLATDGVDVSTVARPGRHRPVVVDSAVFERDNYRCVRPGCGATQHLQVHHWRIDYRKQGPTAYWNLATLCRHDHDLVTRGGHKLEGGPGNWSWIPPPP
jgi:5-methylcytosine-specific restriction endonuclease McrA